MEKRKDRKKVKRKHKRKKILLIVGSLVLIFAAYFTYEFQAGKYAAEKEMEQYKDSDKSDQYEDEFNGIEELNSDVINVLLLGEDLSENGSSRTDTIMIGQYDVKHNRAKLVSLMRDTYVEIPGHGYNKINSAFSMGGPELLRQTIKENFDIDVNYYAIVNFKGFENIVDTVAPEGIEMNVQKRMIHTDIDLHPGIQKLDGEQLLDYARFRSDHENDFGRVRRQQEVMSALKDEVLSFTSIMKLPRTVGTLQPYIDTNMDTGKILSIASEFFLETPDEIETMRIPMDDTFTDETYSHAGAVLELNLEENRSALNEFLTSQPSTEDLTRRDESDEETEPNDES
ncbi:LCP family protein [Piscibacillus halophilus]|uniref:Regulatory protein MsrR n=1 Tax=Piscibacillus halophilus TaxID=571933 RepID=A0A1H9B5S8_9BACI|nr:LCP family protein [Piscibacillus halophilus]SEP84061.1 transcriptional attenuator, LytR family [Piscibacillus halophilus]